VPAWLTKPLVGEHATRFLTTGFPTSAEPFREDFGWAPSLPTYSEGLDRVVERWLESGRLRETDGGYEWSGAGGGAP
jgi:hypothetical protein